MSTVMARRVASLPERGAPATWDKVIDVLAPDPADPARDELKRVAGVAASIIVAESPARNAMVMYGGGPQVRLYCVYGDDAITRDGVKEDPVTTSVTGSGWKLSLPCPPDDIEWTQRKLRSLSEHVTARREGEDVAEEDEAGGSKSAVNPMTVDKAAFLKP
jgi:hypothetical protein